MDLFKFEVAELFLSVGGMPEGDLSTDPKVNRFGTKEDIFPYYEFEVSPRNEFLVGKILSPHQASGAARFDYGFQSGFTHTAEISATGWTAEMRISLRPLGWDGDPAKVVGNLFAVLGDNSNRTYWSSFLPRQGSPDFHKPRYFQKLIHNEPGSSITNRV